VVRGVGEKATFKERDRDKPTRHRNVKDAVTGRRGGGRDIGGWRGGETEWGDICFRRLGARLRRRGGEEGGVGEAEKKMESER